MTEVRSRGTGSNPWLHTGPLRKLLGWLDAGDLGRPTSIRMESLLAGHGGWDPNLAWATGLPFDPPEVEDPDPFPREVAAKLGIATRIFGPIAELACQVSGDGPPRTWLVTWVHRRAQCQGALEITQAPEAEVRSGWWPRSDTVEVTTSTGLAWADGPASLLGGPPLRVYRKDRWHGVDTDRDWASAVRREVTAFAAGEHTPVDVDHLRACVRAANRALEQNERVPV